MAGTAIAAGFALALAFAAGVLYGARLARSLERGHTPSVREIVAPKRMARPKPPIPDEPWFGRMTDDERTAYLSGRR